MFNLWLFYLFNGVWFFLYLLIKLDNFLFKLGVLLLVPMVCIFGDFCNLGKKAFMYFLYKRSLYILSNRKYGLDYFWNRYSHYANSFNVRGERLDLFTTPTYRFHRRISLVKNFYDIFKNYDERLLPLLSYKLPLAIIRAILLPLHSLYLWFVIPRKDLRMRYKQQSFLYRFFITFIDQFEFKDENMHPKYKTAFPFLYMAGLDFYVELSDNPDDEDDIEDYAFLEVLSL